MPPVNFIAMPMLQQSAADQIRDAARQLANDAMNSARQGVRAELDAAIAERKALQSQLEVARSGSARRELQGQLRESDLKIEKLQEALEKLGVKTTVDV